MTNLRDVVRKPRFHAAWIRPKGRTITNREATQMLYSMYPSPIRRWIRNGAG